MKLFRQSNRRAAFSLVEILVAVSLLAVIMLGLLGMFHQTQRAFRLGSTQVDVQEAGRAAMQIVAGELKQIVPSPEPAIPGLHSANPYPMLPQWRSFSPEPQENYLKELFFVRRENDYWLAQGYFVDPITPLGGAGTLYRFSTNIPVAVSNAFELAFREFKVASRETAPRVADGVIHFNLYAFHESGTNYLGNGPGTLKGELDYRTNELPAFLELELGILEPRIYERFRARYDGTPANAQAALQYLTSRVDQVYLFRQRIPIRTVHETLF